MGEVKREVQTVEVNYVCDKCGHGMMQSIGEPDPETQDIPHQCVICGHTQTFQGVRYPRIDYVGKGDTF